MTLLLKLLDPAVWEQFYEYKTTLACPKSFAKELRAFIDARGYIAPAEAILRGDPFPLPEKSVISKSGSQKKRTVYTYPPAENTVLKLLTHLLLRRYDHLFDPCLYSFRPGRSAKTAVLALARTPGIRNSFSYKADISNYFNSIPIEKLLPLLEVAAAGDPELFRFLRSLLEEPRVIDHGQVITEEKGIMAGTPQASFYANLYLKDLDRRFSGSCVFYARYSDDIILFTPTEEERDACAEAIRGELASRGLSLNPDKVHLGSPGDGWTFLGFTGGCPGVDSGRDEIDIAPATVKKLKAKMRRKARALRRWCERNDIDSRRAAAAFIRIFNRKLLESSGDNELSWSMWFFPVITTAESLREIDRYAQDCLRFLLSGTRTKARYSTGYEDLKALGYRSLVNAYYRGRRAEADLSGLHPGMYTE